MAEAHVPIQDCRDTRSGTGKRRADPLMKYILKTRKVVSPNQQDSKRNPELFYNCRSEMMCA